jgi:ribosomal protein S18 acetylase RimI-like enzyme
MMYTIRRGRPSEADVLTRVAHEAKASVGYLPSWIAEWRAELTLTPEYVAREHVFVADAGHSIAGLASLEMSEGGAILEHVWVAPGCQRQGVGQALVQHALAEAARAGYESVQVTADPTAVGFYRHLGAVLTNGVPAPMPGEPDRRLPRMTVPTGG